MSVRRDGRIARSAHGDCAKDIVRFSQASALIRRAVSPRALRDGPCIWACDRALGARANISGQRVATLWDASRFLRNMHARGKGICTTRASCISLGSASKAHVPFVIWATQLPRRCDLPTPYRRPSGKPPPSRVTCATRLVVIPSMGDRSDGDDCDQGGGG